MLFQGTPTPKRTDIELELSKYSRTEFKLKQLKERPLPEGVNPAKLETYLSDTEFRVSPQNHSSYSGTPAVNFLLCLCIVHLQNGQARLQQAPQVEAN